MSTSDNSSSLGDCYFQDIAQLDEDLLDHEEHLKYRFEQFLQTKAALTKAEGSLADFAKVTVHCLAPAA